MTGPAAPPDGEHGWRRVIVAILTLLLLTIVPPFRALLPIDEPLVLVVSALAVCMLVGWWSGGPFFAAVLWVAVAGLVLLRPAVAANEVQFHDLIRGWALLAAGAFGAVSLAMKKSPFFGRALLAVSTALVVAMGLSLARRSGLDQTTRAIAEQFASRNDSYIRPLRQLVDTPPPQFRDVLTRYHVNDEMVNETEESLRLTSRFAVSAFPALLLLETLAALALAWALYHRLNRSRIGAPLSALREFRFNDQLVWGLVAGLAIVLLPSLTSVRVLGINLLVFFGALYAIRGLGVLLWFMGQFGAAIGLLVGLLLLMSPLLGPAAIVGVPAMMLGLGLGDTWLDWRRRATNSA
jgi:hypothetical protein